MSRIPTTPLAMAAVLLVSGCPALAQDCPTAATAQHGFVIERNERTRTEVTRADDRTVRTAAWFGGQKLLETTQFEGLFQLDRFEEGRRAEYRPRAPLAGHFPLKPGQIVTATFDATGKDGRDMTLKIVLAVKEADAVVIGTCRYDVLKIERREAAGDQTTRFLNTDYYSPDLKFVIAKEYRRDGKINLIQFDRIYPLKPGSPSRPAPPPRPRGSDRA